MAVARKPTTVKAEASRGRPNIIKTPISSDFIIRLNNWCDCQKEITICETRKEQEVYRWEWFIAWFQEEKEVLRLPLLNSKRFREEWRKFCLQVERARQRWRFAAYYYVKDMERWLLEVSSVRDDLDQSDDSEETEEADDEDVDEALRRERRVKRGERRRLKRIYKDMLNDDVESEIYKKINRKMENLLPFGFVEWPRKVADCYGHYFRKQNIVKNRTRIVFECGDDVRNEIYNFSVIDFGAKFISGSDPESPYGGNAFLNASELFPITEYWDLYCDREDITEARLALGDANSFTAYPEPIPQAKPLPDKNITELNEQQMYVLDSMGEVRQKEAIENQEAAVARANANIDAIREAFCGRQANGLPGTITITQQRKQRFNRPFMKDNIGKSLPDNVVVSNVHPPTVLLRPEEMMRKYESDICTLMNLPFIFYKPHADNSAYGASAGGAGATKNANAGAKNKSQNATAMTEANLEMYQRVLDDEVQKQQQLFDGLLKEIFYNTFYHLYRRLFESVGEADYYAQMEPRLHFENQTVKSDSAIAALLQYYESGLLDAKHIRPFLFRSLGIKDSPDIAEEDVIRRRVARGKTIVEEDIEEAGGRKKRKNSGGGGGANKKKKSD